MQHQSAKPTCLCKKKQRGGEGGKEKGGGVRLSGDSVGSEEVVEGGQGGLYVGREDDVGKKDNRGRKAKGAEIMSSIEDRGDCGTLYCAAEWESKEGD